MPPDASDRRTWTERRIDARLSVAETTELERLVERGVDRELALAIVLEVRKYDQACRDR